MWAQDERISGMLLPIGWAISKSNFAVCFCFSNQNVLKQECPQQLSTKNLLLYQIENILKVFCPNRLITPLRNQVWVLENDGILPECDLAWEIFDLWAIGPWHAGALTYQVWNKFGIVKYFGGTNYRICKGIADEQFQHWILKRCWKLQKLFETWWLKALVCQRLMACRSPDNPILNRVGTEKVLEVAPLSVKLIIHE